MAKCINCGKSTLVRGHVKLKDGAICTACFLKFGYKLTDTARAAGMTYSEIAHPEPVEDLLERKAAEYDRAQDAAHAFQFAHYGEARDLDATDEELEAYETICELLDDDGRDADALELVRKSADYLTVVLGETDVARIKFTPRVKWITLPYSGVNKLRISGPSALNSIASELAQAYDEAKRINSEV